MRRRQHRIQVAARRRDLRLRRVARIAAGRDAGGTDYRFFEILMPGKAAAGELTSHT